MKHNFFVSFLRISFFYRNFFGQKELWGEKSNLLILFARLIIVSSVLKRFFGNKKLLFANEIKRLLSRAFNDFIKRLLFNKYFEFLSHFSWANFISWVWGYWHAKLLHRKPKKENIKVSFRSNDPTHEVSLTRWHAKKAFWWWMTDMISRALHN